MDSVYQPNVVNGRQVPRANGRVERDGVQRGSDRGFSIVGLSIRVGHVPAIFVYYGRMGFELYTVR